MRELKQRHHSRRLQRRGGVRSLDELVPRVRVQRGAHFRHAVLPRRHLAELFGPHLLPVRRADFETLSLFREPIHVVAPHDHRLAAENAVDPAMLKGETILALEAAHNLYDKVRDIGRDYGAEISHDYEGTSLDTLRQMVAMGMGISLMPALYVRSEVEPQDIVVARPFRGTAPARTIGMVWRKTSPLAPQLQQIADVVSLAARELRAPKQDGAKEPAKRAGRRKAG